MKKKQLWILKFLFLLLIMFVSFLVLIVNVEAVNKYTSFSEIGDKACNHCIGCYMGPYLIGVTDESLCNPGQTYMSWVCDGSTGYKKTYSDFPTEFLPGEIAILTSFNGGRYFDECKSPGFGFKLLSDITLSDLGDCTGTECPIHKAAFWGERILYYSSEYTGGISDLINFYRDEDDASCSGLSGVAFFENGDYDDMGVQIYDSFTYDLPLNMACTSYKVETLKASDNDWKMGTIYCTDEGNYFICEKSMSDNRFTAKLYLNDNNQVESIHVDMYDKSYGAGGMLFQIVCVEPIDPDKNEEQCTAGGWDWSDEVNITHYGYACCGDDFDDDGLFFVDLELYCYYDIWETFEYICSILYEIPGLPEFDCCDTHQSLCEEGFGELAWKDAVVSNKCCGDDDPEDAGYIDSSNEYLCNYEELRNWGGILNWSWFYSISDYFFIHKVNYTNTDVISNADEWFVCDATGDSTLEGNHIYNLETFPNPCPPGERMCALPSGFKEIENKEDCDDTEIIGNGKGGCVYKYPTDRCYDPNTKSMWGSEHQEGGCGNCYLKEDCTTPVDPEDHIEKHYPTDPELIWKSQFSGLGDSFIGNMYEKCSPEGQARSGVNNCNIHTHFCKPLENGLGGKWIFASDTNSTHGCCWGQCLPKPIAEMTCAEQGGEIIPVDDLGVLECYSEVDSIDTINDPNSICCIDYGWNLEGPYFYASNESFICYQQDGMNLFGECCYFGLCENINLIDDEDSSNFDDGNIFTSGSELHTLESYDARDLDYVVDIVNFWGFEALNSSCEYVNYYRNCYVSDMNFPVKDEDVTPIQNYADYDTLEFDIGFADIFVNNISFKLEDGTKLIYILKDYTILPNLTAGILHHIIIPLKTPGKIIDQPIIGYDIHYSVPKGTQIGNFPENATIVIDDFVLKSEKTGFETRYCTGPFRSWIDSLNPPEGTDFDDFMSYGPYWYACDSKFGFEWTGTRCCGALANLTTSETYADKNMGCWENLPVENDETLKEALWGKSYANIQDTGNQILFFNGEFHACNNRMYEGLGVYNNSYYTVLGNHYCSPDGIGIWKTLDKAPRLALLAAKLYQIAYNEYNDYTLHCANGTIINLDLLSYDETSNKHARPEINFNTTYKESACVLKLGTGLEERVIMGAVVKDIEGFIHDELPLYNPPLNMTIMNNFNCSYVYQGSFNFTKCVNYPEDESEPGLYLYYNDKFKIAIFAQEPIDELEEPNLVAQMWSNFIEFMGEIFGFTEPVDFVTLLNELY